MEIVIYIAIALVCLVVGFFASKAFAGKGANDVLAQAQGKLDQARKEVEGKLDQARKEAETIRREAQLEAKDEAIKIKQKAEEEARLATRDLKGRESRIEQREDSLQQREDSLDRRSESLDKREQQISTLQGQIEKQNDMLEEKIAQADQELYKVAGLTKEEAREHVFANIREDCSVEVASIIRESETRAKAEADRKSREILSVAIQRMAAEHSAERTVTSVAIPSDDVKGRIIGREGRNIRSFEQITGVNLIIDDTPEAVTISCFDPVRRETARIALENLIADGRIHPARIEEMFKKATKYIDQQVKEAGEQASFDTGIHDLHPELIKTLGRLKYRTSYGQNVLQHSLEVSALAGTMASELGLDPIPATVLAVLIQAADAVSAARPGARRESYEGYIKRLEKLETIANAHEGVERTYAMQAGREVRVMVQPEKIDDAKATVLAHDIAKEIEAEMQYPGQIHVVVIRESRSEALAK